MSIGLEDLGLPELGGLPSPATQLGLKARPGKPAWMQPLQTEEEKKSLGRKILDVPLGMLQYAGEAISKPGYALRGALAGDPRAALQLVPFGETLGLTTPEEKVSGRKLLDIYGITKPGATDWGSWGAGLAADILTDPLTYSTLGAKHALSGAGKAAEKLGALKGFTRAELLKGYGATESGLKAAGRTAEEIEKLAAQGTRIASHEVEKAIQAATGMTDITGKPLAGLMSVHAPFGFGPSAVLGTGARAQQAAGQLDLLTNWLKHGTTPARSFQTLFNQKVLGQTERIPQEMAVKYGAPLLRQQEGVGRQAIYDLASEMAPALASQVAKGRETELNQTIRALVEGGPLQRLDPALVAVAQPAADVIKQRLGTMEGEALARGAGKVPVSKYGTTAFGREALPLESLVPGAAQAKQPAAFAKRFDVPGGSWQIDDWYKRLAGDTSFQPGQVAQQLQRDMLDNMQAAGKAVTPELRKDIARKAKYWEGALAKADPRYRAGAGQAAPLPFWNPNVSAMLEAAQRSHAQALAGQQALVKGLAGAAQTMAPGLTPMTEVLSRLPGRGRLLTHEATATDPMRGFLVDLWKNLPQTPAGMPAAGTVADLQKALGGFGVTPEVAGQFLKRAERPQLGSALATPARALDTLNNLFKSLVYPIWPSGHVRNLLGGGVTNLRAGDVLGLGSRQIPTMTGRGAESLASLHPSLAGLAGPEAAERLRRLQFAHGHLYDPELAGEISGAVKQSLQAGVPFTPPVPGAGIGGPTGNVLADFLNLVGREGLWGTVKAPVQTVKDIVAGTPIKEAVAKNIGIRGVGGAAETTLPAIKAGQEVSSHIENYLRGSLFNRLLKSGYTPEAAGELVDKYHGAAGRGLTEFERNVMKRIMPFYSFTRANIPLQLETLLTKPRVIQAQTAPFRQPRGEPEGTYVPQWMQGQMALPLGPPEAGRQTFLRGLGLPLEEAAGHFPVTRFGIPEPGGVLRSFLGSVSPTLSFPLQLATGTDIRTGQPLAERPASTISAAISRQAGMDPHVVDLILGATPASRFVSTANQLLDPRHSAWEKVAKLGTGLGLSEVDIERARASDERRALLEQMGGLPNIRLRTAPYVPKGTTELTPEEVDLMRYWTTQDLLRRRDAAIAKRRAAMQAAGGVGGL